MLGQPLEQGRFDMKKKGTHFFNITSTRGQSYKANFGINYIKNEFNKLNCNLNYINFDVIYAEKFYWIEPRSVFHKVFERPERKSYLIVPGST